MLLRSFLVMLTYRLQRKYEGGGSNTPALIMKNYIVLEKFKGSLTGSDVVLFKKDQKVTESDLGGDLLGVALEEKWIKVAKK